MADVFAELAPAAEAVARAAIRRFHTFVGPFKTRDPYAHEVWAVLLVGGLESLWGTAWKPPGNGSHNWGAMQAGRDWKKAERKTFTYTDTHPNSDGTSTPYQTAFKWYESDLEAALDLYSWMADRDIDAHLRATPTVECLSRQLKAKGYYEGHGKTHEERVQNHIKAASRISARLEPILGSPGLGRPGGPVPALRVFPSTQSLSDAVGKLGLVAATVPLEEARRARHALIGYQTDQGRFE